MDLKNEFKNGYEMKKTFPDDNDNKKENINEINVEERNDTHKNEKPCFSIKQSEAVILVHKPLCADYHSESDSELVSSSSESENSSSTTSSVVSDNEDEKSLCRKQQESTDMLFNKLPPIEDLKISVPEKDCMEIGTITNIVDVLVIVEAFKGTPALDVDTVLFLEFGSRTLGKIFEVLGPVTEPVYAIRFNSKMQIIDNMIKKGLVVYYAPESLHTTFVFLSEIMKNRGSDASWKDNAEAPPEFQDFSDDEAEKYFKSENMKQGQTTQLCKPVNSKKYSFNLNGQRHNQKMRNNRFCDYKKLNGCFKSNVAMRNDLTQKIRRTNDISPLCSISRLNFGNPFSPIYAQRYSMPCTSSSQAYFFPSLSTPFPFAKTMPPPPVERFQHQNQSFSQDFKIQWPQCSPSLQNDEQEVVRK